MTKLQPGQDSSDLKNTNSGVTALRSVEPRRKVGPLWNATRVCEELAISKQTLWRRIKKGVIPAPSYDGRMRKWPASEIENVAADIIATKVPPQTTG